MGLKPRAQCPLLSLSFQLPLAIVSPQAEVEVDLEVRLKFAIVIVPLVSHLEMHELDLRLWRPQHASFPAVQTTKVRLPYRTWHNKSIFHPMAKTNICHSGSRTKTQLQSTELLLYPTQRRRPPPVGGGHFLPVKYYLRRAAGLRVDHLKRLTPTLHGIRECCPNSRDLHLTPSS